MSAFAPRRILAPIDLSPASAKTVEWAGLIARAFEASVELFHADWIEAPAYFTSGQVAELAGQRALHYEALEQMIRDIAQPTLGSEIHWAIKIQEGPAIREIEKRLDVTAPDLVVMGSHGRTGAARVLLGSVAENIIRHSASPLLIVPMRSSRQRPGVHKPASVKSILCPVVFTEASERCLEASVSLAAKLGATVRALHAVEDGSADLDDSRKRLCAWLPQSARATCSVKEIVRRGNAAEQILKAASEEDADLIALSAQHRPFLEWSTLGTTTIRVMRHSEVPVLMLPIRR